MPDASQPILIADYGCSSGRNSLIPIRAAVETMRTRSSQPINVVHTDLPANDFPTLFTTVWNDPASYVSPGVFPMAIGRSFYSQLMPADSVTLGWCSWAVAWLSRPPAVIPDHIQVSYSDDMAARSAYARQARVDWADFLAARSAEMRAGSSLVVVVPAADSDGRAGYRPMFEAAWAALTELANDGVLQRDEVVRMGMPHFSRSVDDLVAPFAADGQFAGLTIDHLETFLSTDEFWQEFQSTRDASLFGARWAGIFCAGSAPSLATALNSGADGSRATAIFSELESKIAARLAIAPELMNIPVTNIVLSKPADRPAAG